MDGQALKQQYSDTALPVSCDFGSASPDVQSRDVQSKIGNQKSKLSEPVVILGLGKTGLSCARFLSAQGTAITIVDSRPNPPELSALRQTLPDIPVQAGGLDENLITGAGTLVISPGISPNQPALQHARERGVPIVGDIELFARQVRAPVAAVTGSNGKSTVTTLVGEMARADGRAVRVGGNLGPPALDLLTDDPAELFVLELSSFQLETTESLRAEAAVVLNISPDHMDRYPDLAAYANTKRRIFRGGGVMVLNLDDPLVASMASPDRRTIGFTLGRPAEQVYGLLPAEGGPWLARGGIPLVPARALKLRGLHNLANALAALALGEALGLSLASMRTALRTFAGLPHRCQLVAHRGGVHWYNDSKATNVAAAVAAISGLSGVGKLVLIAGGDAKDADFSALTCAMAGPDAPVRAAVLMGRDAPLLEKALQNVVPVVRAGDMNEAVARAGELARPGDNVLLSPACASLDMYEDYQARGDAFAAAVKGGTA